MSEEFRAVVFNDILHAMSLIQEAVYQASIGAPKSDLMEALANELPSDRLAGGATAALYMLYTCLEAETPGAGAEAFRKVQMWAASNL